MTKKLREWQIRLMLGGIGVVSFGLLMALEVATETDKVQLTDILVDGLNVLLMVATTVGLALLVHRMQTHHEEKLDLIGTGGGSVSVQTTDNNGNGNVDVGDSGTLTASNCVEDGATISGTIGLRFTAVSGDLNTDAYTATVAVTLQSLRASTAAGNAAGSGEFTLAISSTNATTSSLDLTVPSLSVAGTFGGVADTVTMQNFRLTSRTALAAGRLRTSSNVSGTVGSTALAGGTVTLATLQPLVQFDTDAYPSSGQITATGAAGSQMRLTVQSTTNVLLELDANGDGSFESNVVKTWASLV